MVFMNYKVGSIIPLAKAGLGYEKMSDTYGTENTNSAFVDAGVGAKIPFTDAIALKLEAIYMNKYNDSDFDNNLMITAGLNIAFGGSQKAAPTVVDGDDDNDGVLNSADECPTTPMGEKVDAKGCKIDGDDDNDGVLNSVDTCPNTPSSVTVVDSEGCIKEVNLHINFENASYEVDSASQIRIENAANFLKERQNYSAEIIGYTDSVGRASNNQKLSQKRAQAVRNMLIEKGISADRLSATGKGEANPIADNATAKGRAENRRIEAILTKH